MSSVSVCDLVSATSRLFFLRQLTCPTEPPVCCPAFIRLGRADPSPQDDGVLGGWGARRAGQSWRNTLAPSLARISGRAGTLSEAPH